MKFMVTIYHRFIRDESYTLCFSDYNLFTHLEKPSNTQLYTLSNHQEASGINLKPNTHEWTFVLKVETIVFYC